jgi:phosphopantothenoylcysteine decarboxylase/phosphopantothenate--cysteine ligase
VKSERPVVLGVTGSIAAYKACEITNALKRASIDVQVLMTREACEFISPRTLQTLSRNKVITDMFEIPDEWNPLHVSIADRAGLLLIAPASANVIGKMANGICDDILTCVACATRAPVLIAPAMNSNMYKNGFVQENIARLKKSGVKFVGPVRGGLACGRIDIGHLAKVEDIVSEAKHLLGRPK